MNSVGRRLFALLLGLYVLSAAGYLASGDEETMYRVTRNLVGGRGLAVGQESLILPALSSAHFLPRQPFSVETTSAVPGRGAGLYSKYAPGQSLLAIPLYGLGALLDQLWPAWPQLGSRLAISMLNPISLAATGWLLFHFVARLGYSVTVALVISLAFGLSTMVWPYVNAFYPQPATGFFLLLAAFFFEQWQASGRVWWVWRLGMALGAALLMRLTAIIVLPGLVVVMWLKTRAWSERLRLAWRAGLPVTAAIGLTLVYNWLRFGSPFDSGYYEVAWTTPPLLGLYGLLFSSGKGVFLYAPVLFLSVGALPLFFKRHRPLALLIMLWWTAYLAFYAPYNFWTGGFNWGPRFLLPLVAVSLLPCAPILQSRKVRGAVLIFVFLFVGGVVIQFPAVVVDHARYLTEQQETGDAQFYNRTIFIPAFSPILRQFPAALTAFQNFSQSETRAVAARMLQQIELPAADSLPNRYGAQRTLQTNVIRLNLPAVWWLHLPLWGAPAGLVIALALPWFGLLIWGAWGLRPGVLRDLKE